jgi:hypothetical protein
VSTKVALEHTNGSPPTHAPTRRASVPARTGVSGRPRNLARSAVGVLLVLGCALVFASLYRSAGTQHAVLVMARDVPRGVRIGGDDLTTASVAASGLATVPASAESQVVGQMAQVALRAGAPLTPTMFGHDLVVAPGKGVAAIAVPAGLVPPGLRAEDQVQLIVAAKDKDAGATVAGTIVTVTRPSSSSTGTQDVTVAVVIDESAAAEVVAGAADHRVAIFQVPGAAP